MDHVVVAHSAHLFPAGPVLADVRVLPPKQLNTSIYLELNHFARQTAWAHGLMHTYALWLGPVLLAAVFAAAYALAWWRRATHAVTLLVLGGVGTVAALGINQIVSHAAKELRPYATHPHALVLVTRTSDYSFPSDHSVVAGGLTASLLLVLGATAWRRLHPATRGPTEAPADGRTVPGTLRALAGVNVVLGLFLCFARIYVGAHYPGDVVAGYLLASALVLAATLLRPLAYRVADAVEPTAAGTLLRRPTPTSAAAGSAPEPALHPGLEPEGRRRAP